MSLDITTLIVAAARKLLWRPEYISGGSLTRSLRVEYTYKVRHVAPPSRQRVTLTELKTCPKSRVPFILNISLTEPDKGSGAQDGTLLETHVIPVWFSNRDNGEFFQYMPMIQSARDADETVAYVGADKVDQFPFVRKFNDLIIRTESRREPEFRDLCDESVETDSDD